MIRDPYSTSFPQAPDGRAFTSPFPLVKHGTIRPDNVLFPHSEKLPNLLIQELLIRRTSSRPCRVPPQRRDGHQRNIRHEPSLILRVAYRKVQVRLGRSEERRV